MRLTVMPLYVVKYPPMRILPSGWRVMTEAILFAPVPVVNVVSSVPSVLRRAMWLAVVPLYVVKNPPMRILPSGWRVIAETGLFAPVPAVNVVSSVPSVLRRAMRLIVVPLYVVKFPPMRILPSGWRVMTEAILFAPVPVVNVVSSVPSVLRRAMWLAVVPLYVVKNPPMRILPSGWRVIAETGLFAPVPAVNVVSSVPSVLRRAMRLIVVPLYVVKFPPMRILPSGWRVRAETELLAPRPCRKRRIQRAVGVEAGNMVRCGAIICCEGSTDEDFAVGLEGESRNRATCSRRHTREKTRINIPCHESIGGMSEKGSDNKKENEDQETGCVSHSFDLYYLYLFWMMVCEEIKNSFGVSF